MIRFWYGVIDKGGVVVIGTEEEARKYVLDMRATIDDRPRHIWSDNPFKVFCNLNVVEENARGWQLDFIKAFPGAFEDELLCGHCLTYLGQESIFV